MISTAHATAAMGYWPPPQIMVEGSTVALMVVCAFCVGVLFYHFVLGGRKAR
jgi:hypothetical protein